MSGTPNKKAKRKTKCQLSVAGIPLTEVPTPDHIPFYVGAGYKCKVHYQNGDLSVLFDPIVHRANTEFDDKKRGLVQSLVKLRKELSKMIVALENDLDIPENGFGEIMDPGGAR